MVFDFDRRASTIHTFLLFESSSSTDANLGIFNRMCSYPEQIGTRVVACFLHFRRDLLEFGGLGG